MATSSTRPSGATLFAQGLAGAQLEDTDPTLDRQDLEERITATRQDLTETKRLAAVGVESAQVKKEALEARLVLLTRRIRKAG